MDMKIWDEKYKSHNFETILKEYEYMNIGFAASTYLNIDTKIREKTKITKHII